MWAAEHQLELLGTRFRVRTTDRSLGAELGRLLGAFALGRRRPTSAQRVLSIVSDRQGHMLFRGCHRLARSESPADALSGLLVALNGLAVGSAHCLAIHAGVVAAGAVALAAPAVSGAGKSTLVAALVQTGLAYVSDEALCLDYSGGAVVPYPKPLTLSSTSWPLVGLPTPPTGSLWALTEERPVPIDQLGGEFAHGPLTLAHILLIERRPGPTTIAPAPAGDGLAALLSLSFNHYRRPAEAFSLAARAARSARTWRVAYEDAREGAGAVVAACQA